MNALQVDDRVSWWSTRRNAKGSRHRVGTVLRVDVTARYAYIKPDKGNGRYQHIAMGRLQKVEVTE